MEESQVVLLTINTGYIYQKNLHFFVQKLNKHSKQPHFLCSKTLGIMFLKKEEE